MKAIKIVVSILFYMMLWYGAWSALELLFKLPGGILRQLIEAGVFGVIFSYVKGFGLPRFLIGK